MEYLQYDEEELDFVRDQFTFYYSFLRGIRRIEDLTERGAAYEAICDYAFYRKEPDYSAMTPLQLCVFDLVFPVLDSARKKAIAGKSGGSKAQANRKQASSKPQANIKQSASEGEIEIEKEIEKEKEIEIETEIEGEGAVLPNAGGGGFDIFWNYFPKKVCKEQARQEFSKVDVSLPVLLTAIRKQQESIQWTRENGRYIPNPATWLAERRWEDELPTVQGGELKASGRLGEAELAAIRRMMAGM